MQIQEANRSRKQDNGQLYRCLNLGLVMAIPELKYLNGTYVISRLAGIFIIAWLQLSSIYYYPHQPRKELLYQNKVFGLMTSTKADQPEHKADGLLDRKDSRFLLIWPSHHGHGNSVVSLSIEHGSC